MDSFYIPPPFPFPEVWPRMFAEQQQRRWLTPTTTWIPVHWTTPAIAEGYCPLDQAIPPVVTTCDDEDDGENEEEGDDGYEYEYVLSKEWQERFKSSILLQRQANDQKKKKPQKKKMKKQRHGTDTEAAGALHASRSHHLQREIQAAKMRELARKWKHRGNVDATTTTTSPHIEALETSLNMHFDNFCDAFQPVVWPHDSLQ